MNFYNKPNKFLERVIVESGQAINKKIKSFFILASMILVSIVSLGTAAYFWYQSGNSGNYIGVENKNLNSSKVSAQDSKSLISEVGNLILLPEDEEPTIATVIDLEKLKNESFFKQAKQGFRVLIYAKAKKAILYDPISKKIVEVGPINIPDLIPPP